MAKVTVYVTDEQLERLRGDRRFRKGGVSRAFQAFIDDVTAGGSTGRYDYARKVMPTTAAVEAHSRALAGKVAEGGPPADGGPVATALTILVFRELLRRHPDLEAAIDRELSRFGLDELVATELDGVDLLAPPAAGAAADGSEVDEDDDTATGELFGGRLAQTLGQELREVANALRDAGILGGRPSSPRPGGRRHVMIQVGPDDDPREVLTAADLASFRQHHPDWQDGRRLTPEEMETVTDLLRRRFAGDDRTTPDDED